MEDARLLRYSRQIMLPEIDVRGQERLLGSRAVVIGAGGLGSPAAMYMAAAGVGELVIVDDDRVDVGNLQRQIIHGTADIGRLKVDSAAETLAALNNDCHVTTVAERLDDAALRQAAGGADLMLDCSDNFATRFAVNAACAATSTPLVSGAAIGWEGQVGVFTGRPDEPCYQCLYASGEEPEDSCTANGVIAPLVGIIGAIQALEALKLLSHAGNPLTGRLLLLDALTMHWRSLRLPKDPACPVCGGARR
jgi:molybdopterin-synthase adenylyltransferase